jgi:hypothetical protein
VALLDRGIGGSNDADDLQTMTARRVLLVLCAAACAALLAGCGGDTLSFDPVASAASKTADTTSARVEFTANMSIDGVGGMSFTGNGLFDGRSRSGALKMRFTLPAMVQSQLAGAEPTMEMIMDGRDGLVLYVRSPLFGTAAGGRWLKLDMERLAKKEGLDLSRLLNANQVDPSESLRMLAASSDAHPIGYDRVRGVFTTHYRLVIDLERLAKGNDELRASFERLRKLTSVRSFPAEAWIDDQGRIRRIRIDMSVNTAAGGAFTMTMTEELYDFGVQVDVQPPPAADVIDAESLVSRGG